MNSDSKYEARIRPLRERLREETARAILVAAEEVFAEKGLHEARVEEIAARAGVSVGTVYNHFEDREALLAELVESRRHQLAVRLDQALAGHQPFEVELRNFAITVFEHFESHRAFLNILLQTDAAQPTEALREIRARIDALVKRGLAKKALRSDFAQLLPSLLGGAIKGILMHELHNPGRLGVPERAAAAIDFFLNGAGAP